MVPSGAPPLVRSKPLVTMNPPEAEIAVTQHPYTGAGQTYWSILFRSVLSPNPCVLCSSSVLPWTPSENTINIVLVLCGGGNECWALLFNHVGDFLIS